MYTYIPISLPSFVSLPPTLPIPPLQVVTNHRADLPVLCGCFPLFTFGSVYMSMPLSHFVPAYPSPSPYPQVHSLVGLCLYSRLTPRFFMTISKMILKKIFSPPTLTLQLLHSNIYLCTSALVGLFSPTVQYFKPPDNTTQIKHKQVAKYNCKSYRRCRISLVSEIRTKSMTSEKKMTGWVLKGE